MLTVGVTGSIASGKSLFSSFLARRGAVVIDADSIGHELIRKGAGAYPDVVRAFGPVILDANDEIDRGALGRIVFGDAAARRRLEAVVHPLLIVEIVRRVRDAEASGAPVAVVDAALIYELGLGNEFDAVVVVSAPRDFQIARLKERGLSEAQAVERIGSQLAADDKIRRADFHVANPGTPEGLEREAERVWSALRTVPANRATGTLFHGKDQGK